MASIRCSDCDAVISVSPSEREIICPVCGLRFSNPHFGIEPVAQNFEETGSEVPPRAVAATDPCKPALPAVEPAATEPTQVGRPRDTKLCPICGERIKRVAVKCRFCGEELDRRFSNRFDFGNVMQTTWNIFQANFGLLVGMICLIIAVTILAMSPFIAAAFLLDEENLGQEAAPLILIGLGIGYLLALVASTYFALAWTGINVRLATGQPTRFLDLFRYGRFFWRYLVAGLVFGIMYILGAIACLIPGILVVVMFWPFAHILILEDCGAFESLSRAKEITDNNWGHILLSGLVMFGLQMLIPLTFYIGVLFIAPFISLMWAVVFVELHKRAPKPTRLESEAAEPDLIAD